MIRFDCAKLIWTDFMKTIVSGVDDELNAADGEHSRANDLHPLLVQHNKGSKLWNKGKSISKIQGVTIHNLHINTDISCFVTFEGMRDTAQQDFPNLVRIKLWNKIVFVYLVPRRYESAKTMKIIHLDTVNDFGGCVIFWSTSNLYTCCTGGRSQRSCFEAGGSW